MDRARRQDLYNITRYIRRDSPIAAREVARTIYDGCESLINSPHRGRKGKQAGTRELVFVPLPYIAARSPNTISNPAASAQRNLEKLG